MKLKLFVLNNSKQYCPDKVMQQAITNRQWSENLVLPVLFSYKERSHFFHNEKLNKNRAATNKAYPDSAAGCHSTHHIVKYKGVHNHRLNYYINLNLHIIL
jgi:hypothetical protein